MLGFGAIGKYALGQVSNAASPTLTGVAATGAVGTIVASVSITVSGIAGTGAVGTIIGNPGGNITGVAGTGAVGSFTPTVQVTLTGVNATGAVGTITTSVSVTVSGVSGTGAVGAILGGPSVALTGVAGTGAVGTFTPDPGGQVVGIHGTGAVGTITTSFQVFLTGVYGTGAVGTIVGNVLRKQWTLANVLKRLRVLGGWTGKGRSRTMYVGRDFDVANPTESEIFSLDFINELGSSETITSVSSVTLQVFQGTDANPNGHLSGGSSILGTIVSQRVGGNLAPAGNLFSGVTYTFTITINTSLANVITLYSRIPCRAIN